MLRRAILRTSFRGNEMKHFSSVRARLVGTVFLAVAPALALLVYTDSSWVGFLIGMLALVAAWIGGEMFIMRQVRSLLKAAQGLASGDLTTRTGLTKEDSELGLLARSMDQMAEALEGQIRQRQQAQDAMFKRAHQQTAVAALGQFTLSTLDFPAIMNQAMMLTSQTLEVDYCSILEWRETENEFRLVAGTGWPEGSLGRATIPGGIKTQAGYALLTGEPVLVQDINREPRFKPAPFFVKCGIMTSLAILIPGRDGPFGILNVDTLADRVFSEEDVHFLLSTATVLAMAVERKRAEPEFQKLAAFAKFNPNMVMEFSPEGTLLFWNEATKNMATLLNLTHPKELLPEHLQEITSSCFETNRNRVGVETRPGDRILSWSFYPVPGNNVVHAFVMDTTERANLEDQLRQSQKMESIGRMAAGVAHDFNNLLTVIHVHSEMLINKRSLPPEISASLQSILFATERASGVTQQLLLFSRKQIVEPKPLDLNDAVTNLSRLLQRTLDETIDLSCESPADLPMVLADKGMIEQVLMNLAVNARDAMPKGGELRIRLQMVEITQIYVNTHPNSHLGRFVCMSVSDTGCGMDADTMKRIFEPFFTTKGPGKGTGLGLATVYGIIKQHSGWIEVESRLNRGTTFKIFLPATNQHADRSNAPEISILQDLVGGKETILLVEDEEILREVAQDLLRELGYRVVDAGSGEQAVQAWKDNQGAIDLLVTDMILPNGPTGRDLAEVLSTFKPGLKVIFTSGYSMEDLKQDETVVQDVRFLQKPYTRQDLARAVRNSLDT